MISQDMLRSSCAVLGSLFSLGLVPAVAADWSFDPRVAVSAEYDDNGRMSAVPGQEIEVYGPMVDAQLLIGARTPRTSFSLTPRLTSTFYIQGQEDDIDNGYLRLALDHKGERTDAFLNASYSSVVTLGNYFPSSDYYYDPLLGNPDPGVNVPLAATKNREDRFRVGPGVSFDLTERQSLELGADYLDVNFEKDLPGDQDFTDVSVYANYAIKTTNTARVRLLASFDQYEPRIGDNTDYSALEAEWANRWSETAEVYVRGGASFVDSNQSAGSQGSSRSSGFSGGAGVRWAFEVTDIFLDANQYLDPNASGDIVTRTQLRFELNRQLGPMTTLTFALRGIDDSAPPGDSNYRGQQYVTADVGFRWRMTRQLMLFGRYGYRWKERENAVNDAQANTVSLGVAWEPNRK